jgi:hypothetical protein
MKTETQTQAAKTPAAPKLARLLLRRYVGPRYAPIGRTLCRRHAARPGLPGPCSRAGKATTNDDTPLCGCASAATDQIEE